MLGSKGGTVATGTRVGQGSWGMEATPAGGKYTTEGRGQDPSTEVHTAVSVGIRGAPPPDSRSSRLSMKCTEELRDTGIMA